MEEVMEVNGKMLTRDSVKHYLQEKRVILWMDWCITEPDQLEEAVDWFMTEVGGCAAAV